MDVGDEVAEHADGQGDGPDGVPTVLPDTEVDVLFPERATTAVGG